MKKKKATIKDVAEKAGVSISVVSYILNNTPGQSFLDETRKRVIDAARELNYTPNYIAKGMRSSKAMNIGIVLFWNISDSIFNQILIGISKITRQYEYNIILIIPDKKENEFDYINIYKKRQIDGVIIVSPFGKEGGFDETEHVRLIKDENIPAVIINGSTADASLNYIYIDFYNTTYMAANYLMEAGHKNIAYLMPDESESSLLQRNERLQGFNDAINGAAGVNKSFITTASLYDFVKDIKRGSGPAAVVLNKMNYAGDFYKAMFKNNIGIPNDISVIAASDDHYADYFYTPLTSVKIPLEDIGEVGAKTLFDILDGKDYKVKIKLANSIIERESCRIVK